MSPEICTNMWQPNMHIPAPLQEAIGSVFVFLRLLTLASQH